MPVEQTQVVRITCDNPACRGNDLDPSDRTGWTFISSEVYGDPTAQRVFCSARCVSVFAAAVDGGTETWVDGGTKVVVDA